MLIRPPLRGLVAAVSVGMVEGRPVLDLCYEEDSKAGVDMNIVRTDAARYIEVQGTAESAPFARADMDAMMTLADAGIDELMRFQRQAAGDGVAGLMLPSMGRPAGQS